MNLTELSSNPSEQTGSELADQTDKSHIYICDRCGYEMYEQNCKVTCPNCGHRFDCSDLNIYFD